MLIHVQLFATPWTVACQAPLFMGILQARILELVAKSFARGSFQSRDRTQVSCIAGGFFTIWATREVIIRRKNNLFICPPILDFEVVPIFFFYCKQCWKPLLYIFLYANIQGFYEFSWWLRWQRICLQCGRPGFDNMGWENSLEKEIATHSSILAWQIPCMEEAPGLQSMASQRAGHDWETNTYTLRGGITRLWDMY